MQVDERRSKEEEEVQVGREGWGSGQERGGRGGVTGKREGSHKEKPHTSKR